MVRQDAVGAYISARLYYAYEKFVMSICIFEGLVEMCEVVSMELYWELIAKMVGLFVR